MTRILISVALTFRLQISGDCIESPITYEDLYSINQLLSRLSLSPCSFSIRNKAWDGMLSYQDIHMSGSYMSWICRKYLKSQSYSVPNKNLYISMRNQIPKLLKFSSGTKSKASTKDKCLWLNTFNSLDFFPGLLQILEKGTNNNEKV